MSFENFPKLFDVKFRKLSSTAQSFNEFEKELTAENVSQYNRERKAYLQTVLHKNAPLPDVERLDFQYSNGGYTGSGIVYRPASDKLLPVAVYIHGGGWTTLSNECYEYECAEIALQGQCVVFNIEYRLALEGVKFPTPQEDCYAALLEIASRAIEYGGDSKRIALIGDSAGGNLAAGIALMARSRKGPRIALQVLCYPAVGFDTEKTDRSGAGALTHDKLIRQCFDDVSLADTPYISPILDKEKELTPPTMILIGSCDFLLDDNLRYAKGLSDAGVDLDFRLYQGMPHGFIQMTNEDGKDAVTAISRKIADVLKSSASSPLPAAFSGVLLKSPLPASASSWFAQSLGFSCSETKEASMEVVDCPGSKIYIQKTDSALDIQEAEEGHYTGLAHIAFQSQNLEQSADAYVQNSSAPVPVPSIFHNPGIWGTGMDYFNPVFPFGAGIEVCRRLDLPSDSLASGSLTADSLSAGSLTADSLPISVPLSSAVSRIDHIGIPVSDLKASISWYEALGFTVESYARIPKDSGHTILCCMMSGPGVTLELFEFTKMSHEPFTRQPFSALIFRTDAFDAMHRFLTERSIRFTESSEGISLQGPDLETILICDEDKLLTGANGQP